MSGGIRNEDDLNYMAGTSKPKWVPGQRLNTAAEALRALADGEKLGYFAWPETEFIFLDDRGAIRKSDGGEYLYWNFAGHHIYTPPKRKVVSTRWFAIIGHDRWTVGYRSEEDARYEWPDALAYTCANVEIEIDGSISVEVEG